MGADIHIYAERKLRDGTWSMCRDYKATSPQLYEGLKLADDTYPMLFTKARGRHYDFFAALAGVRGDGPEPKGLPPDVSPLVKEISDGWDVDGHSHSWYSARDFVPKFMEHWIPAEEGAALIAKKLDGYGHGLVAEVLAHYLGIDVPYVNDVPDVDAIRFVFWFDN